MRVTVDRDMCEGHGQCVAAAPQLFELDDDGELRLNYGDGDIPADQFDAARSATASCPVAALRASD